MLKLGEKVKDKITGLEGVIVVRSEWLYGCIRLGIQPMELKDAKPADIVEYDEAQLEPVAVSKKPKPRGGPSGVHIISR